MNRRAYKALAIVALVLAAAVTARAQWETPNRAFHNATSFPLEGRHLSVACESCHLNGVLKGTPNTCFSCHWIRRQDDRYALRLGAQCEQCHRPTSWTETRWNHAASTGVPLNMAHQTLGCDTCHKGGQFKAANVTCVSCHQADYNATTRPNHAAAGFPTACETCHKPADATFTQARFDHSTFPLVGVHATATCENCHRGNVYKGTARDCVGCHRSDFDSTDQPNHSAAGFSTTCDTCHRPTDPSWAAAATSFNHSQFFQLVGVHATQTCATCHRNSQFHGTARDCVGCHRPQYDQAKSPNHVAAAFPTTCEQCHQASAANWGTGTFNHNQFFQLVGVHAQQACTSCHRSENYKGTSRDCVGCHRADYDRTQNPSHAASGFSTACEQCHQPASASWRGGGFNHNQVFQLVGVHATQACASCHANNVFRGTPRDCVGCHRPDYDRTRNPNHVASGFSTACQTCHQPASASWNGASFNHNAVFQLVGVHATQACASCHVNNVFSGTPRDCVGCHRPDYDKTQNPNHAASGFSTSCQTCHQPASASWSGASFNHSQFFQLVGVHATQACAKCHVNNVYKGTPRDCYGCHRTNYERTTNPNHAGSGFSTTCETCHRATDTSWNQGTFNHRFPRSGPHNVQCASCHLNPANYREFSCTVCHQRAETDSEHQGRSGYRYDSAACYSCHPTGRE